mmetsp:Transcript_26875/g.50567  ORF Transcript_26875/g.50567 Transcript_26875/m.50567 type:complete len:92 (-) Transcript_26875:93-368(-)
MAIMQTTTLAHEVKPRKDKCPEKLARMLYASAYPCTMLRKTGKSNCTLKVMLKSCIATSQGNGFEIHDRDDACSKKDAICKRKINIFTLLV